jgi:hypothetical protein
VLEPQDVKGSLQKRGRRTSFKCEEAAVKAKAGWIEPHMRNVRTIEAAEIRKREFPELNSGWIAREALQ